MAWDKVLDILAAIDWTSVTAIASVFLGIYLAQTTRNKDQGQAVLAMMSAAEKSLNMQRADNELLEEQLHYINMYTSYIYSGMIRLIKQMKQKDITPVFIPITYDEFVQRAKEHSNKKRAPRK